MHTIECACIVYTGTLARNCLEYTLGFDEWGMYYRAEVIDVQILDIYYSHIIMIAVVVINIKSSESSKKSLMTCMVLAVKDLCIVNVLL